jgi:YbbR domain-containing protein
MIHRPQPPQWRRIATPIALAAVSLFAALVLWIAVSDAENPRTEVRVSGNQVVPINVPEGLAVQNISPNPVVLMVRANSDLKDHLSPADFQVTVDLTNTRESTDAQLLYTVVTNEKVDIISVSPEVVSVTLEPSVQKTVPIRTNSVGQLPQGYTASTEVSPTTARVTGASSIIALVDAVTADVNLTGLRANLTQQITLVPRDSRGLEIGRVSVEPARAELKTVVQQQDSTVSLSIVPSLQGAVADGYNIVGVTVDPAIVQVNGNLETTQALGNVSTEPVDVSGLSRDISRTVRLRLPSGVQANRDTVVVRVRIAPAQGEILVNLAPQVTNVPDGLTATLQTSTIAVRLAGDVPSLRGVTPGTLRATVSASGLQEGVSVVEPQIAGLPSGVQVVSTDPSQVVLTLRR